MHEFTFGARGTEENIVVQIAPGVFRREPKPKANIGNPEYFILLRGLVKRSVSADVIRKRIRVLGSYLEGGVLPTYQQVIDESKKSGGEVDTD
jgi:hypothetical protein